VPVDIDVDPLRLKAALRDFVALSAIPAVSVGREPDAVAAGFADSLVEVLQLEFVLVRMSDPGGVGAIEVTRGSAQTNFRESLESHVGPISGASHEAILDVGDGSRPCHGIAIPIGVNGEGGLVVAASSRTDFPSAIDRVLLSLTANHAAIAFENARLIHERDQAEAGLRKARDELEARVAERTAALNVANEELSALRRVATLVAEAAAPSAILDAVAGEMQALLDADQVALNRFEPGAEIVVLAHRGLDVDRTPVGSRVSHEGENVTSIVRRTGSPARMENYAEAGGALAAVARATGLRSSVSAPITVEGEVWGVVTASWKGDESPPADTEDRMVKFAHLIDTAIANTEARAEVEQLAEEQAALRRVATLVAGGAGSDELFAAVADEVQQLLGAEASAIVRFEDDGTAVTVGTHAGSYAVGTRTELDPHFVVASVRGTRRAARFDTDDPAAADMPAIVREWGIRSAVASPIVVEGELWGAIVVASRRSLPQESEARLGDFTDLVATAVANTQARQEVTALADEQAALRRVAVLVAQQPSPSEVFTAVTEAVGLLLDADLAVLHVFPGDGTATTVASWGGDGPMLPIGTRFPLDGDSLAARIFESAAPARMYSHEEAWQRAATVLAQSLRVRSAVGAPILVEGKLWGALMAATRRVESWAENAETRIAAFTELVATAIANAESREARAVLTEEQAALRRVATLVAETAPPAEIFSAVGNEVAALFGTELVVVGKFDGDPAELLVVGVGDGTDEPVLGSRWKLDEALTSTAVYRTGLAARFDHESTIADPDVAAIVERLRPVATVAVPIKVESRLWGAMIVSTQHAPLPTDTEDRLQRFTDLIATAIANAEGRSELAASRRRIVAASDDARRRIERDLHDGVQQQLVSLGLELGALKADPPTGDALKEQLAGVTADVGSVLDALVEIARGIHPAILSQGGLAAALKALARRSAVPVELHAQIEGPLPDEVEAAAYYVAAEALTNAAKHARASVVHMDVTTDDGTLTLMVQDDGVGGADPGRGSGLVGLQDRVEALGGTIKIDSSAGRGTGVVVTLPIATEPDQEIENLLGPPRELGSPTSPA
jgi:signal transduction histidine kinase